MIYGKNEARKLQPSPAALSPEHFSQSRRVARQVQDLQDSPRRDTDPIDTHETSSMSICNPSNPT